MNFTAQQQLAIAARGNVLVMAGAGTGKTRTLVERCARILAAENPPVSLDEILLVTFTEAAAAEMRRRIRARMEEELEKSPRADRWRAQIALFDTAHIGTLHSFCFQLVRQHFYELDLDPQLAVLDEAEARLLADETLDAVLEKHYAGDDALAGAVQNLIQSEGRGWDKPIRSLVLKLHNHAQALPDPEKWLAAQIESFNSAEPARWRGLLASALTDWMKNALAFLQPLAAENLLAAKAAENLAAVAEETKKFTEPRDLRSRFADVFERLLQLPATCPSKRKGEFFKPLAAFFSDAEFLASLVAPDGERDPLAEDWEWSRHHLLALLRLAGEFHREFSAAKRERGALDFHDLEQNALRLLWDANSGQPAPIALEWRRKLRFVFVDEYQDINAAQDKIIEALGGDGANANRFLVGDVKQSIYRFRLADPRIFQNYAARWRDEANRTIPLTENFRSREGILAFVNSLFALIMRRETGGIVYDDEARLRFGAPENRGALRLGGNAEPRVELHLRLTGTSSDEEPGDSEDATAGLSEANQEARLVALRLRELKEQLHQIWDEAAGKFRAVEWSDMAVLLRSPSGKAEIYAKEFAAAGVPLLVARGGLFSSLEILDLLNVLRLLDNPLQDAPLIAVLRSPLVGLSLDELAAIRLAATSAPFWTALVRSRNADAGNQKTGLFLERFARWRQLARQASLSRCLETVLDETLYCEWLRTQPRGDQRAGNVSRLLNLTRQFDQFQRQGLFRFLRFVEAQQDAELEPEVAAESAQNAVRLLSIHQSKGLEFPVVCLAGIAKRFNEADLRAPIILDEEFGLCAQVKPPQTGERYPSLPYWLARRRQKLEMLGEELRLLYVATTRARDTLLLAGTLTQKYFEERWRAGAAGSSNLAPARSFADWLGGWFRKNCPARAGEKTGAAEFLAWRIWDDGELSARAPERNQGASTEADFSADEETWRNLEERLRRPYPFAAATQKPAKASVTALRRGAVLGDSADESSDLAGSRAKVFEPKSRPARGLSAAETGAAHHRFLQHVALEQPGDAASLAGEAERLEREKILSAAEAAALDLDAIAAFWQSGPGREIIANASRVHRELEFTARFSAREISEILGQPLEPGLEGEFTIVQGVADLAVILEKEIWLVDFKTDGMRPDELGAKVKTYAPQLKLYALALARIYRRPVTNCWLHFLALRKAVRLDD